MDNISFCCKCFDGKCFAVSASAFALSSSANTKLKISLVVVFVVVDFVVGCILSYRSSF